MDQYEWKGVHFPSESKDKKKKFERNSPKIALNVLFAVNSEEKINKLLSQNIIKSVKAK